MGTGAWCGPSPWARSSAPNPTRLRPRRGARRMAGIQMSGLVSGLDTASIIDQLMAVEKIPRTKITLSQDATTKKQSLLQDISTKLTSLKFANDDLKSFLSWGDTQTVESADTSKFTVTRTAGAAPGGYDVSVDQ